MVPRTEASTAGDTRRSGALYAGKGTLPFHGAGSMGLNAPEHHRKNNFNCDKKEKNHRRLIYAYLGYWQYWNELFLINSSRDLISILFASNLYSHGNKG